MNRRSRSNTPATRRSRSMPVVSSARRRVRQQDVFGSMVSSLWVTVRSLVTNPSLLFSVLIVVALLYEHQTSDEQSLVERTLEKLNATGIEGSFLNATISALPFVPAVLGAPASTKIYVIAGAAVTIGLLKTQPIRFYAAVALMMYLYVKNNNRSARMIIAFLGFLAYIRYFETPLTVK